MTLSEHCENVSNCLSAIRNELSKHNFASKGKAYKNKIERIVIKEFSDKFGLKYANIRMIYYGKI